MKENRPVKFYRQKVGDLAKRIPTANSRFGLWKSLLFDPNSNAIKLNLSAFVCFIPVIAVIYMMITSFAQVSAALPFSSYIGVGYPTIIDATAKAFQDTQGVLLRAGVYFLPLALFVSLALSISVQYATRNYVWTEGSFKFKTLFKAFKFNLQSVLIALIVSLVFFGFMYGVYFFRAMLFKEGWTFLTVIILIAMIFVGLILLIASMYAFSISITYKENVFLVFRDAFALTFKMPVMNLMMAIAVVLPLWLIAMTVGTMFFMLVLMAFLFIGFTYMLTAWTVYSQYVFDLVTGANEGNKKAYSKK